MELKILNKEAKDAGKITLPEQFTEEAREDLVKRAVLAIQANNRQRYGASPEAGKRASAYVSKRRRAYKTTYGIGQSRTPRKVMSRSGTRMNWVGAFAPQTVGGRRAHPPKASKIWTQKVNILENRKAIRSALAATIKPELVKKRGHKIPTNYPFALTDDYNDITKTKDLIKSLTALGLIDDVKRADTNKIRAGKGKARGRKHRAKKSILFVVAEEKSLIKAANNLPGCDVILVKNLNAEILAPGATLGRLTLFTQSAIKKLNDEKLFAKTKTKAEKITKEQKTTTKKTVKKTTKTAKKATKKVIKKTTVKKDE